MRVVVVLKRTAFRAYGANDGRVRALLRRGDPSVARLREGHFAHEATVREVEQALRTLKIDADFFEDVTPLGRAVASADAAITVGGDGTLLLASHRIGPSTPVLAINSAPRDSVGFFCGAKKGHVASALRALAAGKLSRVKLTRMAVKIGEQVVHQRVLNDALFCHASPAATSRYILEVRDGVRRRSEEHRSSGLWIGPAAGSTAAQRSAGGKVLPLASKRIQYVVREPYAARGRAIAMARGTVSPTGEIRVLSKMQTAKLFLDGEHAQFDCIVGDVVQFSASPEPIVVLGLTR
jgi:NAD+ kinase